MNLQNASMIRELSLEDQPRERLMKYGEKSLANHELLAIILRTGTRGENVLQLAQRFIYGFSSLNEIKHASLEQFQAIKGIGPAKAVEIKAAIEWGMRIAQSSQPRLGCLTSTRKAGEWLMAQMSDLQQEHLITVFLNSKNEIIYQKTIFIGSLNASVAHPREIFKEAVKYPTARLILAHNHPSGNPEPSQADLQFTQRMIMCGDMMGIEVIDHLIIGNGKFMSLREETDLFDV